MNDREPINPDTVTWQGLDFITSKPLPNYQLLTAAKGNGNIDYEASVEPINELNSQAIQLIEELELPNYQKKKPTFSLVVVPSTDFMRVTGIPENYSWATVCSRGIWRFGREDAVVSSSDHLKTGEYSSQTPIDQLSESQFNILREGVHEHLPTLRDTYLPYPSHTALPISEAMDETIPRYVMGFQRGMDSSTQFLKRLKNEDILTIDDLWNGFSRYSSDPISTNRAYGSAFLLGRGMMQRFQEKHGINPNEALSIWLDAMVSASDGRNVVDQLAKRLDISPDFLWKEKVLQFEGQELL